MEQQDIGRFIFGYQALILTVAGIDRCHQQSTMPRVPAHARTHERERMTRHKDAAVDAAASYSTAIRARYTRYEWLLRNSHRTNYLPVGTTD